MAKAQGKNKAPTNTKARRNNKRTISQISGSDGPAVNQSCATETVQRQDAPSNSATEALIDSSFDEYLANYRPIRDLVKSRSSRINSSQESTSTIGASDQEHTSHDAGKAGAEESHGESISVGLDIMRTIKDPNDLKLAGVGSKSLKCFWPVRRIHNMTGLSKETQEQVHANGLVDDNLRIKAGVELYAKVIGNTKDKWYIFNLARKKVVSFDDKLERKKIDEQLSKKENKDRKALKEAMTVAQQMLDDVISKVPKATEVSIDYSEVNSKIVSVSVPKEKNVPMAHQLQEIPPKPVEFRAGMPISYSMPIMGDKGSKIIEVRYDEGLKNYMLELEDSYLITDDVLVGAGDNKIMFPFSTLRSISTFVEGKEGSTAAERTFEKLANAKDDLLATLAGAHGKKGRKRKTSS